MGIVILTQAEEPAGEEFSQLTVTPEREVVDGTVRCMGCVFKTRFTTDSSAEYIAISV